MKFCEKCGFELDDKEKRCPRCGHKLNVRSKLDSPKLLVSLLLILFFLFFFTNCCKGYNDAKKRSEQANRVVATKSSTASTVAATEEQAKASASDDTDTETTTEVATEPPTEFPYIAEATDDKYDLKVVGWQISSDYKGNPVVVIEYQYTNKDSDPHDFRWTFNDTVYQNGIECDSMVIGCKVETDNIDSKIQTGTTINIKQAYELHDTTSPVNIVVEDSLIFNDTEIINANINIA